MFKSRIDSDQEILKEMKDVKAASSICNEAASKVEAAIARLSKSKASVSANHDLGRALKILKDTSKVLDTQLKNGVYGPTELCHKL